MRNPFRVLQCIGNGKCATLRQAEKDEARFFDECRDGFKVVVPGLE